MLSGPIPAQACTSNRNDSAATLQDDGSALNTGCSRTARPFACYSDPRGFAMECALTARCSARTCVHCAARPPGDTVRVQAYVTQEPSGTKYTALAWRHRKGILPIDARSRACS